MLPHLDGGLLLAPARVRRRSVVPRHVDHLAVLLSVVRGDRNDLLAVCSFSQFHSPPRCLGGTFIVSSDIDLAQPWQILLAGDINSSERPFARVRMFGRI